MDKKPDIRNYHSGRDGWRQRCRPARRHHRINVSSPRRLSLSLEETLDALLTAFDSRYSTNPFGLWYFAAVEMGKLYFDIRWTNSPAQNYWGWVMIFDPQATSNVYGPYGAGCASGKILIRLVLTI